MKNNILFALLVLCVGTLGQAATYRFACERQAKNSGGGGVSTWSPMEVSVRLHPPLGKLSKQFQSPPKMIMKA